MREGLQIIADKFASVDHYGPAAVAAFEEITDPEERAIRRRDAFERVRDLLERHGLSQTGSSQQAFEDCRMAITKPRPTFTFDQDRLDALAAIAPEAFADGTLRVNWEALREALARAQGERWS